VKEGNVVVVEEVVIGEVVVERFEGFEGCAAVEDDWASVWRGAFRWRDGLRGGVAIVDGAL